MNLKNMLGAASLNKEDENNLIPLFTPWGENLDSGNVLSEYPRPQMRRKNYTMLNGVWDYRILNEESAEVVEPGKEFVPDGQILVPFSPESQLSGVGRQLQPEEQLWYQRRVVPKHQQGNEKRCILHFEAVDFEAEVYVNGKLVIKHSGGYLPFEVDITDVIIMNSANVANATNNVNTTNIANATNNANTTNVADAGSGTKGSVSGECRNKELQPEGFLIQVCVRDDSDASYHSRGKQKRKRGGIFYSAQSGIWQSVWYEWVPDDYLKKLEITPDFDKKQVKIRIEWGKSPASVPKDSDKTKDSDRTKDSDKIKDSDKKKDADRAKNFDGARDSVRIWVSKPGLYIHDGDAKGENDLPLTRREVPMEILSVNRTETKPGCCTFLCALPEEIPFLSWTPEHPYLYPLSIDAGQDHVESYFAMRTVDACRDEKGILRFCLNHEPLFLNGVLDQGYWPDGLMTAPSDEALVYDIRLAQSPNTAA